MDGAAAFGAQLARRNGQAGVAFELHDLVHGQLLDVHRRRQDVVLHIGAIEAGAGADIGLHMRRRQRQQPLARNGIARRLAHQPPAAAEFVDRHRARLQPPLHADDIMVLKVGADARQRLHHRDAHARPAPRGRRCPTVRAVAAN